MIQKTELVTYRKATEIARVYEKTTTQIQSLLQDLQREITELKNVFENESGFRSDFDFNLEHHSQRYSLDDQSIEKLIGEFKRSAWSILIRKLEIEKLMSSKKQQELRENIHYHSSRSQIAASELPEITEESILSVLSGYINSADELLEEKIREEFDWLRPYHYDGSKYKTNKKFEVGKKVIKGYCVEKGYRSEWRCTYTNESHLVAIDSIFHLLDGKGIPKEHKGPLLAAIQQAGPDGYGQTEYFKFRCCKNGNIHLEFRRLDLLKQFNHKAGKNRLGTN